MSIESQPIAGDAFAKSKLNSLGMTLLLVLTLAGSYAALHTLRCRLLQEGEQVCPSLASLPELIQDMAPSNWLLSLGVLVPVVLGLAWWGVHAHDDLNFQPGKWIRWAALGVVCALIVEAVSLLERYFYPDSATVQALLRTGRLAAFAIADLAILERSPASLRRGGSPGLSKAGQDYLLLFGGGLVTLIAVLGWVWKPIPNPFIYPAVFLGGVCGVLVSLQARLRGSLLPSAGPQRWRHRWLERVINVLTVLFLALLVLSFLPFPG